MRVQPADISITPETTSLDFEINSAEFETFFYVNEVSGSHTGDYVWTINWRDGDDPGGIQINPTSEDSRDESVSAKLWKSDEITKGAGTYYFSLTRN